LCGGGEEREWLAQGRRARRGITGNRRAGLRIWLVNHGYPPPRIFAKSHHSKGDKVVCFVSVLKPLIVKELGAALKVESLKLKVRKKERKKGKRLTVDSLELRAGMKDRGGEGQK
jgi:hypothetical protein